MVRGSAQVGKAFGTDFRKQEVFGSVLDDTVHSFQASDEDIETFEGLVYLCNVVFSSGGAYQ